MSGSADMTAGATAQRGSLDLRKPGASCRFRCRPGSGPGLGDESGNGLQAITSALAAAPIADMARGAVALRRLRNVRFEQPLREEDEVEVEVAVDRTRRLKKGALVSETSWTLTNDRREVVVELTADIECEDARDPARGGADRGRRQRFGQGRAGIVGEAIDADYACVDSLPV